MTDRNDPELQDSEVTSINSLPEKPFEQFIQLVYQFLVQPKQSDNLLVNLQEFCEEAGVGVGACKHLLKSLLSYLRSAARKGFTGQLLQRHLGSIGVNENKSRYWFMD